MRLANEYDAEFILSLRLDSRYNLYISDVSPNVEDQRAWLRNYKNDESLGKQYYFIIEKLDGTPCGTVRIYDLRNDSFCWGSWILNDKKTRYSAVESALLVYEFGFDKLGFDKSHFEVDKRNEKVVSFHEKFGATKVGEDPNYYYFEIEKKTVDETREKLRGLHE